MILFFIFVVFLSIASAVCLWCSGIWEAKKENGSVPLSIMGFLLMMVCEVLLYCASISSVGSPFWLSSSKVYKVLNEIPVEGGFIVNLEDEPNHAYYSVFVERGLLEGTAFVRPVNGIMLVPVKPYSTPIEKPEVFEAEKVPEKPEE